MQEIHLFAKLEYCAIWMVSNNENLPNLYSLNTNVYYPCICLAGHSKWIASMPVAVWLIFSLSLAFEETIHTLNNIKTCDILNQDKTTYFHTLFKHTKRYSNLFIIVAWPYAWIPFILNDIHWTSKFEDLLKCLGCSSSLNAWSAFFVCVSIMEHNQDTDHTVTIKVFLNIDKP